MGNHWICYVDETDGNDRESWSIFYGKIFVAYSEADARAKGQAYLNSIAGHGEMEVREAD